MAAETGQLLGEITSAVRFYATENLERLLPKWAQYRRKPLSEQEFRRIMPLLQSASMESDDSMQERWARLLDSVSTQQDGVLPSFSQCLAQLTPIEARYLDQLWERVGSLTAKYQKYDLEVYYHDVIGVGQQERAKAKTNWESMRAKVGADFSSILSNLVRRGVIERDTRARIGGGLMPQSSSWTSSPSSRIGDHTLIEVFGLSEYGRRFLKATAGPAPERSRC